MNFRNHRSANTRLSALGGWHLVLPVTGIFVACSFGALAVDRQPVQVSSLEVKARIASMEQVNVTAEKPIELSAPAPSSEVADLLAELVQLDAETSAEQPE